MNPKNLLAQITATAAKKRLDPYAKKRFIKDLEAVAQRLEKDEYRIGGFAMNVFDVPDRMREFFINLEFYAYLGRTWVSVLKQIDLSQFPQILDLCPGYTPKVELALFYLKYTGTVVIADKDPGATKQLEDFMHLFEPQYAIKRRTLDLFENFKDQYPLIVGNHIIDDLVIDYFSKKFKVASSDVYEKEGVLKKLWQKILAHEVAHTSEIVPHIVRGLQRIVAPKGWLLLSQYESYMERILSLKKVPAFNKEVLKQVVQKLCASGFVDKPEMVKKARRNFNGKFKADECYIMSKHKNE